MSDKRLLLIEDNQAVIKVQRYIASKAGLEVTVARSLEQAKNVLEETSDFFCSIVDYNLPDAASGQAIPYVLSKEVPVIVVTGQMDNRTRERILRYPTVDYIYKESPLVYDYLLNLLKNLQSNQEQTVMVVDDSRTSRAQLRELLKRHFFKVVEAESGNVALAQLQAHPDIRIVITDQEMPGMDGIQFTSAVRRNYAKEEIIIIGLSGSSDSSLSARFLKIGANDYLTKPFCPEELYCRIESNLENIKLIEKIRYQANTDYLTGLPNRRYFFSQVNDVHKQCQQNDVPASVAIFDIDHFKRINDSYGHDAGDAVLIQVARLLDSHFNNYFLARFGGEEFCLYAQDVTSEELEGELDEFRQSLAEFEFAYEEGSLQCTISIGLSEGTDKTVNALIAEADELLYQAKTHGRNQVRRVA